MDNKTTTIEQAFFDGGFILFFDIYTEFVAVEWKSWQWASRQLVADFLELQVSEVLNHWKFLTY